jgi:hypothetical protein
VPPRDAASILVCLVHVLGGGGGLYSMHGIRVLKKPTFFSVVVGMGSTMHPARLLTLIEPILKTTKKNSRLCQFQLHTLTDVQCIVCTVHTVDARLWLLGGCCI